MIFSNEQVKRLLAGEDVVLVTLKKEGDWVQLVDGFQTENLSPEMPNIYRIKSEYGKTKHQVGRSYAVCQKNKSLWHCPKCNLIQSKTKDGYCSSQKCIDVAYYHNPNRLLKPLRFVVKSIKSQQLLDVTEEQAKKAGYDSKYELFGAALSKALKKKIVLATVGAIKFHLGDPEVWVFEVVKK